MHESVKSADGREWDVRASRFRLPPWRENGFDPWNHTTGVLDGLFSFLVLLPVFMVIVPLATWIAELPVAFVRGAVSREGWIEAVTTYPQEIKIIWRVADRRHLPESFERVTQALAQGYDAPTFDGVAIVAMTPPAALQDRSS